MFEIIVFSGLWSLGLIGLVMFYTLHHEKGLKREVKSLRISNSKAKAELRKHGGTPQPQQQQGNIDIKDLSLDEAMKEFGLDAKELDNPLIRPVAERIFQQIKQGMSGENDQQGKLGY